MRSRFRPRRSFSLEVGTVRRVVSMDCTGEGDLDGEAATISILTIGRGLTESLRNFAELSDTSLYSRIDSTDSVERACIIETR